MRWLCALLLVAGCKGDRVKCEKGLRNYAQLVFWAEADAQIAAAPEGAREELRKEKLAKFERDMENGLDSMVSRCVSANNDDQINCMINAKTATQAKACSSD